MAIPSKLDTFILGVIQEQTVCSAKSICDSELDWGSKGGT